MIVGDEALHQVRHGALCFGISTRGNVVVAAAPCAKWTMGRTWPDVVSYYTKKGATIERVDVNALKVALDPPRVGAVRVLNVKTLDRASAVEQSSAKYGLDGNAGEQVMGCPPAHSTCVVSSRLRAGLTSPVETRHVRLGLPYGGAQTESATAGAPAGHDGHEAHRQAAGEKRGAPCGVFGASTGPLEASKHVQCVPQAQGQNRSAPLSGLRSAESFEGALALSGVSSKSTHVEAHLVGAGRCTDLAYFPEHGTDVVPSGADPRRSKALGANSRVADSAKRGLPPALRTHQNNVEGDEEMGRKKNSGAAKGYKAAKEKAADRQPALPGTVPAASISTTELGYVPNLAEQHEAAQLANRTPVQIVASVQPLRPHFTHVHSNVQGGINCRLGRLNLIVGPNASKKTALVRAVELAASGIASDIRWRDTVAAERDLLRLVREGLLVSEATASDGKTTRYAIGEGGGKKGVLATPYTANGARMFQLRALREALLGTPDTLRKFFLGFAVGKLTIDDVLGKVANIHHKRLETVGLTKDTLDIPTALVNAIDECGKRARGELKKAGNVEEVANVQGNALAPEPTQEQMAAARTRFANAQRYHTVASLNVSYADVRSKLDNFTGERTLTLTEIARCESNYPVQVHGTHASVGPIEVMTVGFLDFHVQHGLTMCLGCGTQNIPTNEFLRRRDGLIAASAQVTQSNADRQRAMGWLQTARNRVEVLDGLIAEFGAKLGEVEAAAREWGGVPTVEWAQAERDTAQSALAELERVAASWKMVHNTQKQGAGAENLSEQWKLCGKELKRAAAELLGGGVEAFRTRVQRYLPPSDVFVLEVDEKSAEIGLKSADGELDTALSGAQGMRVLLAVASTIIEDVPRDTPVVLVADDRSVDADTLEAAMRALAACDAQVFFPTTTMPTHVPDGWRVIRTARGEHDVALREHDDHGGTPHDDLPADRRPNGKGLPA